MKMVRGSAWGTVSALIGALSIGAPAVAQEQPPTDDATIARPTGPTSSVSVPQASSRLHGDARILGFLATPFGGNQSGSALGFVVGGNVGWERIPVSLGVDVMTAYWGTSTERVLVQAGNQNIAADRNRDDLGYFLDLSLRVQPIDWWLRPYLEGFVGTKLLETRYSLSFPSSGTSTSTISDHDWAGSIGWGFGIDIAGITPPSLGVTLGVRRLSGGDATYSRSADINGNVAVRYTTPTSSMFYLVGVSGTFGVAGASSR